jgi:hypothetical protein
LTLVYLRLLPSAVRKEAACASNSHVKDQVEVLVKRRVEVAGLGPWVLGSVIRLSEVAAIIAFNCSPKVGKFNAKLQAVEEDVH